MKHTRMTKQNKHRCFWTKWHILTQPILFFRLRIYDRSTSWSFRKYFVVLPCWLGDAQSRRPYKEADNIFQEMFLFHLLYSISIESCSKLYDTNPQHLDTKRCCTACCPATPRQSEVLELLNSDSEWFSEWRAGAMTLSSRNLRVESVVLYRATLFLQRGKEEMMSAPNADIICGRPRDCQNFLSQPSNI